MIAQRIRKLLSVEVLTNQKRHEKRPFLNRPLYYYRIDFLRKIKVKIALDKKQANLCIFSLFRKKLQTFVKNCNFFLKSEKIEIFL